VFSFDRIKELIISNGTFEIDEDFDAENFFSECFGVVRDEEKPVERIVLRAYGDESLYLRDLPIHHSQVEIGSGKGYTDFECYVRPTLDFCGQILSRGCRLQVLKPQSLADKIHQMLADALKNYEKK
jgi:predicted DNA-binding transcriptional regulator YafY